MGRIYGIARTRDRHGVVVSRRLTDYTMCVHCSAASGRDNMLVLVAEESDMDTRTMMPDGRGWAWHPVRRKWYRIRKLTPGECLRLMDVDEIYVRRMLATDSAGGRLVADTHVYHAAGNSIVVGCLARIFENIWYPKEGSERKTLFGR